LDAIGKEAEADFEDEAEEEDNEDDDEDDLDFEDDEDDEDDDDDGEEMFCPHCSEFERHASTCPTLTGNK
jgi:hypothetical protein